MEIDFHAVKKDVLTDPNKRKKYHASVKDDLSSEELIEQIEIMSGVSATNVRESIKSLAKYILNNYEDGDILTIESMGTFRVSIDDEQQVFKIVNERSSTLDTLYNMLTATCKTLNTAHRNNHQRHTLPMRP